MCWMLRGTPFFQCLFLTSIGVQNCVDLQLCFVNVFAVVVLLHFTTFSHDIALKSETFNPFRYLVGLIGQETDLSRPPAIQKRKRGRTGTLRT